MAALTWPEIARQIANTIHQEMKERVGDNWEMPVNLSLTGRIVSHQGELRGELQFGNYPDRKDAVIKFK